MTNYGGNGGWTHENAEKRREAFRQRLLTNPMKGNRPKGSKNKNPYPRSDAVARRYKENPPPSWEGKQHTEDTKLKMSIKRSEHIEKHGLQMSYKGRYTPRNPKKYVGDPTNIVYRSLWERRMMVVFDENDNIVKWSSEELSIPYISPLDKRQHRYFPDFCVEEKQADGSHVIKIIEVKPMAETSPPIKKARVTKKYIHSVSKYLVNHAKWTAAKEYATKRGWQFGLMTEREIFPGGHK